MIARHRQEGTRGRGRPRSNRERGAAFTPLHRAKDRDLTIFRASLQAWTVKRRKRRAPQKSAGFIPQEWPYRRNAFANFEQWPSTNDPAE